MRLHRVAWLSAVIFTAAVGALGTAAMIPSERAMATIITMAYSGGFIGVAWAIEVKVGLWRGARNGALLFAAAFLSLVCCTWSGTWGAPLVAVLVVSAPAVWRRIDRLRGRSLPARTKPAGLSPGEEAFRRQWVESGVQLRNATTAEDRLLWVEVRSDILDALAPQSGDPLPDFVWESSHRPDAPTR
ncbi:MAG: hypothetical protein J2P22_07305 [Nocardioides sp.]|nr:hypothetical protein [Nocardioides sp.]